MITSIKYKISGRFGFTLLETNILLCMDHHRIQGNSNINKAFNEGKFEVKRWVVA